MVLALEVATLARAWTRQIFARKPPSGDGSYDGFNLRQVPFGASPGFGVIPNFSPSLSLAADELARVRYGPLMAEGTHELSIASVRPRSFQPA
jgi:hypothetical protein